MRTSSALALIAAALLGACGKGDKTDKSGGGAGAGAPVDKTCADKRSALQKVFDQTAAHMQTSPYHQTEQQAAGEVHADREKLVAIDEGAPIDPRSLKIVMVGKTSAMMATPGAVIDVDWDAQVDPNAERATFPGEVIPDEPLILWIAADVPRPVAMNFLRRAQMDRLGKLRVAYRLKTPPPPRPPVGLDEEGHVDMGELGRAAAKEATRACPSFAKDLATLTTQATIDASFLKKLSADVASCSCDFDPRVLEPIAVAVDQAPVTFVPVTFGDNGAPPSEEGATWADAGPAFAKLANKGPIRFPEPPPPPAPPKPPGAKK